MRKASARNSQQNALLQEFSKVTNSKKSLSFNWKLLDRRFRRDYFVCALSEHILYRGLRRASSERQMRVTPSHTQGSRVTDACHPTTHGRAHVARPQPLGLHPAKQVAVTERRPQIVRDRRIAQTVFKSENIRQNSSRALRRYSIAMTCATEVIEADVSLKMDPALPTEQMHEKNRIYQYCWLLLIRDACSY